MTIERYRHRRTRGSGPPPDLLYGEIAYSDADEQIHVGRPNGTAKSFTTNPAPTNHTHSYAPDAGTWTPIIVGNTTAGVGTYTTQEGIWDKLGPLWFLNFSIAWTAHTGTGAMRIGGLPLTISPINIRRGTVAMFQWNIPIPEGRLPTARGQGNSTQIILASYPATGGQASNLAMATSGSLEGFLIARA